MKNLRLEGLKREANDIEQQLREQGLMGAELEVIGALLFTKFQGEDKRLSDMFKNTADLMRKTQELLDRLKKDDD